MGKIDCRVGVQVDSGGTRGLNRPRQGRRWPKKDLLAHGSSSRENRSEQVWTEGLERAGLAQPRVHRHRHGQVPGREAPAHGPLDPADVDAHEHVVVCRANIITNQDGVERVLVGWLDNVEAYVQSE
jgi:hypothetical protein